MLIRGIKNTFYFYLTPGRSVLGYVENEKIPFRYRVSIAKCLCHYYGSMMAPTCPVGSAPPQLSEQVPPKPNHRRP